MERKIGKKSKKKRKMEWKRTSKNINIIRLGITREGPVERQRKTLLHYFLEEKAD